MENYKELFDNIYSNTRQSVYKYITAHCYDLGDIDDIYQNTYLTVFDALQKRSEPVGNEEGFCILIAKRELFKYYGILKRITSAFGSIKRIDADDYEQDADSFDLEDHIVTKALAREVAGFIDKCDITTQKIFYMYYRDQYPLAEIAGLLNISESSVKSRLYGTLSRLRRLYRKD
ncbi:MAG: sigma-70 family RNA polymerase sigma factor [Ruminococcus sp.]|nr:sigma-70 family RNA polymerase sigma factor [Ruminococcus sp.]